MTHPAGLISYVPEAGFRAPRSYITTLKVHTNHFNVPSYADGLITWVHDPIDAVIGYTKLRDDWWLWNSSVFPLSRIVEWWYYVITPSPTEFEWGGELSFAFDPIVEKTCLVVATVAADIDYYFPLPPTPSDYWTQPE